MLRAPTCIGQSPIAEFNYGISVQHYTDENGLPQNSVSQLSFDDAGFLWFATNSGLVRYDGNHFLVVENHLLGFTDPVIQYIFKDNGSDLVYVISRSGDLGVIHNGKYNALRIRKNMEQLYKPASPLLGYIPGRVFPYAYDGKQYSYIIPATKNVFFTLADGKLTVYGKGNPTTIRIKENETEPWRFFVVGNKLYYLTPEGRIREYGDRVKNITPSGDLTKNKSYAKNGSEIRAILNGATGEVFIYLENSLYLMQENKDGELSSTLILEGFNFSDHTISSICYDKINGRLFLGSYTDGLFVFKKKQFATLSSFEIMGGHISNSYSAQIQFGKNGILTSDGSVFGMDGLEDYLYGFSESSDVTSIARDAKGEIWTKRISSLYHWDRDAENLLNIYRMNRIISVIYPDKDSCIWIGTKTPGGLYKMDLTKENAVPKRMVASLPDVNFIGQGPTRDIWLGTSYGLYLYDAISNDTKRIEALRNKNINSIYVDEKEPQNVYVTVEQKGIYLYKNGQANHMPLDGQGFLTHAKCMLKDTTGYFWITTTKGLFRVYGQDFIDYVDKKNNRVYYQYYGKSNGFNTNEFNGDCQPCGTILDNGNFSFPSLNGLVIFNPYSINHDYPVYGVYIDRIEVDDEIYTSDDSIYRLPSHFKRIEIYYTSPYFGSHNNLNFETRLNEDNWQPTITNPIIFTSLPVGVNKFQIRKIDNGPPNEYKAITIQFDRPPAYWQTWWFILLCVAIFVGIIYSYTKLRVIYIKRQNDSLEESISERTLELKETIRALKESKDTISRDAELQKRLTASIAHDVKTPLKYLLLTAGSLSKIPAEQLSGEQDTIKTIYQSLYRIYHFTDNLLAYIKTQFNDSEPGKASSVQLRMLIQEKIDIFQDVAKSQSTVINNGVDDSFLAFCNKDLLSVVIHNLIDNAVKFTFKGKIEINAIKIDGHIQISMKDTGVGIHPEQMESIRSFLESKDLKWDPGYNKHNGLGLVIIKEFMNELGGWIHVDSVVGKGTKAVIYLPF
jgi:signal transduction histidine kinase/ligand-binding sensor domain-containing protein